MEVSDRGVYRGAKALKTLFTNQYSSTSKNGNHLIQFVTTPSIEVAGDRKIAKGMWRCLHLESVMPPSGAGDPDPIWAAGAYAGTLPSSRINVGLSLLSLISYLV